MKIFIAAIALIALQSYAYAETPSTASLEKLLEVTQAQRLTETAVRQVNASMKASFKQALDAKNFNPEQREKADQFQTIFAKKMNVIMADELSWDRMKAFTLQAYGETFSQQEVNDLIAFYESPSGRAFVEKMPIVMQKSMAYIQQRIAPMNIRIQAALKETASELQISPSPNAKTP